MNSDIRSFCEGQSRLARPLFILGPCQIESRDDLMRQAESILEATRELSIRLLFKASFDKANRTSLSSKRGPGMHEGLRALSEVREQFSIPVITDIHLPEQAAVVAEAVDVLQIPAFLCRQTDLLIAAGATQLPVNLKKGQFLHPLDILQAAEKLQCSGTKHILLCERGSCFGYRDLIVDQRSFTTLREAMHHKKWDFPLVFDATHSTQSMGGHGNESSGNWRLAFPLAAASIASGADAIFAECHTDPQSASSDREAMIPMSELRRFVGMCVEYFETRSRLEQGREEG